MTVVCAWCGARMHEKPPHDDARVSHGICPDCFKREAALCPMPEPPPE